MHFSISLSLLFSPSSVFLFWVLNSSFLFFKFIFNWRIFVLQCCVGFCCTMWKSSFQSLFFFFCIFYVLVKVCASVLFPSSVNIFIIDALNSLSGKLLISLSLCGFSGVFSCSFSWEQFLSLFILLYFLCPSYFRRNSCLLWSYRGDLRGNIPVQTVCPVPWVGELGLPWRQITSFLRLCWQLTPW